ncbi:hypothetical protein V6Z11_A13G083800 [Gossypium hirsutum]
MSGEGVDVFEWIEVSKIPIHCWNYEMFKRIARKWGTLVSMAENWSGANNFEKVEMMISISQVQMLNKVSLLEVGDVRFSIRIKERGWYTKEAIQNSPNSNEILESEGWDFSQEVEEEFSNVIRSRRKKKQFNKRISSMRKIQDRVLSSKEKQKRDQSKRKGKSNEELRREDKVMNLSLSDSDISNRRKVILRKAKQTWEIGKKLGLSMKIVSCNVKGLGLDIKITMVNKLVRLHRVDVCFLQETKLEEVSRENISKMWGDDNIDFRFTTAVGRSGRLITIWDKASFMLKKDMCSNRLIVIEGLWCSEGWEGVLINSERSNCVGLRGSRDLGKFIENCKLVDLPLLGKKFTWLGPKNKKSRLDRFLIDEDWFENSEYFQQQGLKQISL